MNAGRNTATGTGNKNLAWSSVVVSACLEELRPAQTPANNVEYVNNASNAGASVGMLLGVQSFQVGAGLVLGWCGAFKASRFGAGCSKLPGWCWVCARLAPWAFKASRLVLDWCCVMQVVHWQLSEGTQCKGGLVPSNLPGAVN
jgi:hypothetical protein